MELWNEANGIPRYDVSSWGQVFDKQKFRLLKQTPDKAGYLRVKLWIAGERKTVSVHRYLGVSPGSVSKTLRGLQPACKGYTFERIGGEAHDS